MVPVSQPKMNPPKATIAQEMEMETRAFLLVAGATYSSVWVVSGKASWPFIILFSLASLEELDFEGLIKSGVEFILNVCT